MSVQTQIDRINGAVSTQKSLIAQIKAILKEKTGDSGGGGFIYPDGAFAPVTAFTDGKQYALVAVIDGVIRYINTTTYNNYTMNATQIDISEDAGAYVIFTDTPALFTAVASGNGFLLQNGNNYLHGTTSNGTALRVGTTQAVWTVDTSETGGFASGKYYAKEDANAVWLFNNTGGYDWSIKFETAGSFGFDRSGRDNTYSTGFVSFVLYEYVAGETSGEIEDDDDVDAGGGSSVVVLPTLTNPGTAADLVEGKELIGADGKVVTGNVPVGSNWNELYKYLTQGELQSFYEPDDKNYYLTLDMIATKDVLVRSGADIPIYIWGDEVGNAKPEDVRAGVTFTSGAGLLVEGTAQMGGGGMVVKSGNATSRTIDTGLSNVEQFFMYKESQTGTGLIHLHYTKSATSRMYASAWSTQNYGTKTITNGTGGVTVSGGTVTISATQATQGALTSGVTYKWIAVGTE